MGRGVYLRGAIAVSFVCACNMPRAAPPEPRSVQKQIGNDYPLFVEETLPDPTPSPAPPTTAPRELVLQGGHAFWIYDATVHPEGSLVALLSIDMPDMGQEMTPPELVSTVTILDPRSGQIRASWRVPAPDLGDALGSHVRFSRDGERLALEGHRLRAWDLRDGSVRTPALERATWWSAPDPMADVLVNAAQDGEDSPLSLSAQPLFANGPRWSRSFRAQIAWGGVTLHPIAWHPSGDRFVVGAAGQVLLVDRDGRELARRAIAARDVSFGPRGGAIYTNDQVLHPRTLDRLGRAPWDGNAVFSDDGARAIGGTARGQALFDARTGAVIREYPASDDDEMPSDAGPRATFVPGTHRFWMCSYQRTSVSTAPSEIVPPNAGVDDWIDFVQCRAFDEYGRQRLERAVRSPIPFTTNAGPVSISESGPVLVATVDDLLVIALMHRVLVLSSDGELLHTLDDVGLETLVRGAIEMRDGIALATPVALGAFRSSGADAQLCPDVVGHAGALRVSNDQPVLFATRYRCVPGVRPTFAEAILGASHDGRSYVIATGNVLDAEGGAALITPAARRVLRGIETWCQVEGCGPNATFLPGDSHFEVEGALFDARTGRRVREDGGEYVAFSPSGRFGALRTDDRLLVKEVRTGRTVMEHAARADPEEGVPPSTFADEQRVLFATADGVALLEAGRVRWSRQLDGVVRSIAAAGDRAVVLHDRVTLLRVLDGTPLASFETNEAAFNAANRRAAWCEDGTLRVLAFDGDVRVLGPCVGTVVHLGERYVVSADGSRARVTRLADGESLRVRIAIYPGRSAWTVAEDDRGNWHTQPTAPSRYLVREPGSILEAPLIAASRTAPGYDAQLVERFFAVQASSVR